MHLVVNMMVLLMLGIPLEMVHHWWRVLIVYLAGVVAGSLGTSVTDPYVYLAGASGGVYAIITAHLATIIMVFYMQIYLYGNYLIICCFFRTGPKCLLPSTNLLCS
jgi:membrane associated rhomboid family serine protease